MFRPCGSHFRSIAAHMAASGRSARIGSDCLTNVGIPQSRSFKRVNTVIQQTLTIGPIRRDLMVDSRDAGLRNLVKGIFGKRLD